MILNDFIANQGEVLFVLISEPWFCWIQMVIFWTACHWHDFDCCVGKLTVPSSWTSWRLSLRWTSYKIQCEWTSFSPFSDRQISLCFKKARFVKEFELDWGPNQNVVRSSQNAVYDFRPNVKRRFSFNQTLIKCLFKVPEQAHKMEKTGIWQSPCCIKTSEHEFPSFCRSTRGGNLTSHYFGRFWILHTHRPKTNYPY